MTNYTITIKTKHDGAIKVIRALIEELSILGALEEDYRIQQTG